MTFGVTARIGLIVPANNSTLEPELWWNAPPGVAFYSTRILASGRLTPDAVRAMEPNVDRAVDELIATGVDVIVYADMVTSFIMEDDWNRTRTEAIAKRAGVPCISAWTSMADALRALDVTRISLGTPYPTKIHALALPFFAGEGYQVVGDATLDIEEMAEVPEVTPERLRGLTDSIRDIPSDAIVLLATDLPTFTEIETIERRAARPVLSSNQVIFWRALHACGASELPSGLGRLFDI